MICRYCGKEIPDGSTLCPGCGANLVMENSFAQNGYQQNGYQQNGYQQNGYQQNGYQQYGYPQNGYPQNGYQQSQYAPGGIYLSQNYTILNSALSEAKNALVFAIVGLVLAAGIGLIFSIVAYIKSGKEPMVDVTSLLPEERMLYDQVMGKLRSAKIVSICGFAAFVLAIIGGFLIGIFTAL